MKSTRILVEMIVVMLVSVGGMFLLPAAKTLFSLIPIAYLLIERSLRHRTWAEVGLNFRSFGVDLRANWVWFLLVGVVTQPLTLLIALFFLPDFVKHVLGRLPLDASQLLLYLPLMAVLVLGEELTYRSLLQGRLSLFIKIPFAVLIASAIFALAHFAPGPFAIVAYDLGTIFIDAVLLGIIYARSNNAAVTWAAHFLGNTLGLIALVALAHM